MENNVKGEELKDLEEFESKYKELNSVDLKEFEEFAKKFSLDLTGKVPEGPDYIGHDRN